METIKTGGRRTGRTTRIIDEIIQELFNNPGNELAIIDHHPSFEAAKNLTWRIERRLKLEHPGVDFETKVKNKLIKIKLNQPL